MTRRMLINTRQSEELRVALTDNHTLFDFDIESKFHINRTGNIYLGTISRVEPSLNAAFVSYGSQRHAFLPFKEIHPSYLDPKADASDMKTALKEGTRVVIQVNKDERGNKGAAVSTYITLAGCYLVIMPNNERAGGISRRIEGEERQQLKDAMRGLQSPKGIGVICRTAGLGRSTEELQWDLDVLVNTWNAIQTEANSDKEAPFLIYRESDVIQRSIRDYLRQGIDEIVVDTKEAFDEVSNHIKRLRPDFANHLKLYEDERPLFAKYKIEGQIESAYTHEVTLPSGGSIVFDHAEALTAIDINSARATKGGDIEETALQTNIEAAKEIARQARLRDLGGLIVIDFIDMLEQANQKTVENTVMDAFGIDRARVQFGRISRFGLFEMSRQRLRPSLKETTDAVCPRCEGKGLIRSIESLTISILRHLQDEVLQKRYLEIHVQLPVEVATFMLNEKRAEIAKLEADSGMRVALIPNSDLQTPQYVIKRHKKASINQKSYELKENLHKHSAAFSEDNTPNQEVAAIQSIEVPEPPKQRKIGLLKRIFTELFGERVEAKPKAPARNSNSRRRNQNNRNNQNTNRNRNNRNRKQNPNTDRRKKDQTVEAQTKQNNTKTENATQKPVTKTEKPKQAQNKQSQNRQTQNKQPRAPKPDAPQCQAQKAPAPASAPAQKEIVIDLSGTPETQKPVTAKKPVKTADKPAAAPKAQETPKPAETDKPKAPRRGSKKASDVLAKAKKPSTLKQAESKTSSQSASTLEVEQIATKTKAPAKTKKPATKKSTLKQVETKK